MLKFCAVAIVGALLNYVCIRVLRINLKTHKYLAYSAGFMCAASAGFILNRIWTFHSRDPMAGQQYFLFVGIAAIGAAINSLLSYLLKDQARLSPRLTRAIGAVAVIAWSFLMNYYVTFAA